VEPYERPTAENDEIPTNVYGNVYLFQQKMIPLGCVHVVYPNLKKILQKLNIPHAPAMVRFLEFPESPSTKDCL
jgi:hypothetical protein